VNQSAGRVIRHANDFGAITFCDLRLGESKNFERLSGWLREARRGQEKYYEEDLKDFFKCHVNPK
jgi:Rad3-related DNA helicase